MISRNSFSFLSKVKTAPKVQILVPKAESIATSIPGIHLEKPQIKKHLIWRGYGEIFEIKGLDLTQLKAGTKTTYLSVEFSRDIENKISGLPLKTVACNLLAFVNGQKNLIEFFQDNPTHSSRDKSGLLFITISKDAEHPEKYEISAKTDYLEIDKNGQVVGKGIAKAKPIAEGLTTEKLLEILDKKD